MGYFMVQVYKTHRSYDFGVLAIDDFKRSKMTTEMYRQAKTPLLHGVLVIAGLLPADSGRFGDFLRLGSFFKRFYWWILCVFFQIFPLNLAISRSNSRKILFGMDY